MDDSDQPPFAYPVPPAPKKTKVVDCRKATKKQIAEVMDELTKPATFPDNLPTLYWVHHIAILTGLPCSTIQHAKSPRSAYHQHCMVLGIDPNSFFWKGKLKVVPVKVVPVDGPAGMQVAAPPPRGH